MSTARETSALGEDDGFGSAEESTDARVLLYATGWILETIDRLYGADIQPTEIRHRTKSAASIITQQVGHDGCMAMEGFEVQDLLCRLSGLFTDLVQSMRRVHASNAASFCSMMASKLSVFCGRYGGGDRRSYKAQTQYSQTVRNDAPKHRPPSPGRMS